ncbi:MAG: TlpA family protein disulfide reductase [Pyrinomonadaceae bacterium]
MSFAFLLAACRPSAAPVTISNRPISINDVPQTNLPMAPSENIENLGWQLSSGNRQTLGELKGKVVILDFWATYCPPCLEEIPHLAELQNKYADLQIVGLHVGGDEDKPKVPAFVAKLKMNYPLGYPQDELIDFLFNGDDRIPQTFVFDKNGNLVKKFVGFDAQIKSALDEAVRQTLNSKD